jgi:exodeoxyribonuclease-3
MRWLTALRQWVGAELAACPDLVLMGDYNIAPEDRDVYDPVAWAGQIHCTPQEREHFQGLVGLGLVDAFRLFEQPPKSWSWWDYRNLAFRKNQGLRIDHILVSEPLKPRVQACVIDKLPRKNEAQRPRTGGADTGRLNQRVSWRPAARASGHCRRACRRARS